MAPPGRKSNSQTGLVNPWGPHHCATCFGSVHTLNRSSLGASKIRVSTSSCSFSFVAVFPVAKLLLLILYVAQIVVKPSKLPLPETPEVPAPSANSLKRPCLDRPGPQFRPVSPGNQPPP